MDGWMDGWMGGWIDGWMDGSIDGWVYGWREDGTCDKKNGRRKLPVKIMRTIDKRKKWRPQINSN